MSAISDLEKLACAGHTQASAAREVNLSRERVRQLADENDIRFVSGRNSKPTTPLCRTCSRRRLTAYPNKCLACYWTPERIARFRKRLKLGQIEFSLTLGMGAITVCRWEENKVDPSNRGLQRLEALREAVSK